MNARPIARGLCGQSVSILFYLVAGAGAIPLLHAQNGPGQPDDDWRALQSLLTPDSRKPSGAGKSAGSSNAERAQQAERYAQAAQQAKDFYTRYPTHGNAGNARKLEVTASLESAQLGKAAKETDALALAAAFRGDKNQLREARLEVALAADRYRLRKKLGGKSPHGHPADYEKLADGLRDEFGPIDEVFGLYTGIAASVDMESANRIATKILEMRPPAFARASAEVITAHYGLLGRPLPLRLTGLDGRAFDLAAGPAGAGPTVLYVWTAMPGEVGRPFAPLAAQKRNVTKDARWIFLGLGASAAQATAAQNAAPVPGVHCADPAGPTSAIAQRLKVRSYPMVFVLNRQGVLTGFGRVDELSALLATANH